MNRKERGNMKSHTFKQQPSPENKLVIKLITNNPTPSPTRTTVVVRNHPRLQVLSIDSNDEREIGVQLRCVIEIRIPGSCFGAGDLDCKGCRFLGFDI